MSGSVTIRETGQVRLGDEWVVAANIWRRAPLDDDSGPEDVYVELQPEGRRGFDVRVGDVAELGGLNWRVDEVVEDPEQRRGRVVLTRIAQD